MPQDEQLDKLVSSLEADLNVLKRKISTASLNPPAEEETCAVAEYIVERLKQLNVSTVFGLPGDFNMGFLDYIEADPKLQWAGNCNELNAAYAADGYARIKQGSLGVLVTTFGVGELSAVNGIAGAYAERVPVLHIVGVPSTSQQTAKPLLHHTLGDGRFDVYEKIYEQVTCAHTNLTDENIAGAEIDRVISAAMIFAKPTYLMIPTDMVTKQIPKSALKTPLEVLPPKNDPVVEEHVVNEILKLVDAADRNVSILVDACAVRYNLKKEVRDFVEKTQLPVYATPMGKTVIDESYPRYGGIYVGRLSRPDVRTAVESSNLVIYIGGIPSDANTGQFSFGVPKSRIIELHSNHTLVHHATYQDIRMRWLLPKLTEKLAGVHGLREAAEAIPVPRFVTPLPGPETEAGSSETILQEWLWPRMGKFFKKGDLIVADTGTAVFGLVDVPFPEDATFVTQILWGSIGWSVGCALGVGVAARDLGIPRTILFVGDGSLELTAQELSTIERLGLKPIIFVLNNSGYTIERLIHGPQAHYNDIADWKWTHLLSTFGGTEGHTCESYTVRTKNELSALLKNESFGRGDKVQLVEIVLPTHDAPLALKGLTKLQNMAAKQGK